MHYAAARQGTTGGLNQLYTLLTDSGADENVVDVVICKIVTFDWPFSLNLSSAIRPDLRQKMRNFVRFTFYAKLFLV